MARAALLGRLSWRVATVAAVRDESPTARTLVLNVPGWPGHAAGQHVDIRLTAPDGYTAVRSYSIASVPDGDRVALTVEQVPGGEVSPYLAEVISVGDPIEVRGPIGGWFVWRPDQDKPVQLVAGGSGVVPLMAIVRAHAAHASPAPLRLLYSAREPASVIYRGELARQRHVEVTYVYTRRVPPDSVRPPGRVDGSLLAETTWPATKLPTCYVCGPTGFVEAVADLLIAGGHDAVRVRTERFGPSGGT